MLVNTKKKYSTEIACVEILYTPMVDLYPKEQVMVELTLEAVQVGNRFENRPVSLPSCTPLYGFHKQHVELATSTPSRHRAVYHVNLSALRFRKLSYNIAS